MKNNIVVKKGVRRSQNISAGLPKMVEIVTESAPMLH
jgi:hypothetical protein